MIRTGTEQEQIKKGSMIMFGLQDNKPAAPAGQPAGQPPAPSPNPATPPVTQAQAQVPAVAVGADQKAQKIREAMMTSSVGGKRNEMPVGSGLFLIKEGIFKLTPTQQLRLTSFQLYCVKGETDGQGLRPESPQYTGPRIGETYEFAVFHDTKYPNVLGSQYLQITAACMGWTPEKVTELQSTPEGQQAIMEMTARIMCVDANGNQVMENGQPVSSIISNQAILDITKKAQIKDKKINGQPAFDAAGQKMQITVTNTYFNKRVWLDDLVAQGITEEELLKAFGSTEAATAAYQMEQQYKAGI